MSLKTDFDNTKLFLMEGALGERLKREYNIKIDGPVAMASLIYSEEGKEALRNIWNEYKDIAKRYNLPFMATTPTRRANRDRVLGNNFSESIIKDNVNFLRTIIDEPQNMYLGGLMGCKGDAYTGEGALDSDEAYQFHSWQAQLFKEANVDFLYAGIMPTLPEAIGMAKAMSDTNIPYIISFTIRKDGCLIDGSTISHAIETIDSTVDNAPLCYMTNCVHPIIVNEALSQQFNMKDIVRRRFLGIQANTSSLSYEELDGCCALEATSSASDLANGCRELKDKFGFKIFGGCCGTDNHYMEEIASSICR